LSRKNGITGNIFQRSPIHIVDLFSGIGGLSLGWIQASSERTVELVAAVDADPNLEEAFAWNFPTSRFIHHSFGDHLQEDESTIIAKKADIGPRDIDVLLAAPPCQTFSAAGKRALDADSRLVFHVCDLAVKLQPKIVLIENVPEFSRAEEGRLLGRVRVRMANAGYNTEVLNFSAAAFGVPQMRMRCFTLAVRKDLDWLGRSSLLDNLRSVDKQQFVPRTANNGIAPDFWREPLSPTTVGEAINDLPPLEAGEGESEVMLFGKPDSQYQRILRENETKLYNHVAPNHSPELIAELSKLKPGDTPQDIPNHPLRRKDYYRGAYARLDSEQPAMTITTQTQNPGSGRFTHYRDNRVITVREVARLQSFPDIFRFFGTQAIQRRHVGNAVPPFLAQAIATALLPILED
jgi:DNA (cytosine-5)-methyltransferase 1